MESGIQVGITIYDSKYWSGGIGTKALKLWIDENFCKYEKLEHIGLTTWSGNIGMMKAAEKAGMKKEAQIRKVRFWKNTYYDSISYGILRSERS
ncbi:GNAT family N-acetyltransferase [Treponema pedis]|uniref:GNAT family N-acetyltransferase n=1 Tax=Treponema pedis TaxID=409322 RepID=UPI003D23178D